MICGLRGQSRFLLLQGEIHARDGHIYNAAFDTIDGHLTGAKNSLRIDSLVWKNGEGSHHVKGTVGLETPHELNLRIESEKIRIESILKMAGMSYPVTGWVENTVNVTGTSEKPSVSGGLSCMGRICCRAIIPKRIREIFL